MSGVDYVLNGWAEEQTACRLGLCAAWLLCVVLSEVVMLACYACWLVKHRIVRLQICSSCVRRALT